MNRTDVFIPSTAFDRHIESLTDLSVFVFRFADDNDSVPSPFGIVIRRCKDRAAAVALMERSTRNRYMGRKRHGWSLLDEFVTKRLLKKESK